jgi:hypothetical protein
VSSQRIKLGLWAGLTALLAGVVALSKDPAPLSAEQPKSAAKPADGGPVSVEEARARAKLLHNVYSSTLDVMHHRYFRSDHAVLPARAMEDVFADMDKQSNIQARWISVNTTAMSIQHEPASEFEKKAAGELASGKSEFERVENGFLLRATPIPLKGGCVGCHTKPSPTPDKTPRFAGLVICIPVKEK